MLRQALTEHLLLCASHCFEGWRGQEKENLCSQGINSFQRQIIRNSIMPAVPETRVGREAIKWKAKRILGSEASDRNDPWCTAAFLQGNELFQFRYWKHYLTRDKMETWFCIYAIPSSSKIYVGRGKSWDIGTPGNICWSNAVHFNKELTNRC